MENAARLAAVRTVHTIIYLVMAGATFVLLYGGITGHEGPWLWMALGLLVLESAVYLANGFACPLSALARRYGATTGYVFDTFLPERATRYTFRFFGTLMAIGLALLALRWIGVLG